MFRKYVTSTLMAMMVATAVPILSTTAAAQSRYCTCRSSRHYASRRYHRRYSTARSSYASRSYTNRTYATQSAAYRRPGFYSRHRKAINLAAGTGAGMLLGGLLGGRRGAGIGALAGAGGGAIFTHVQRPRNYTRRVYY